MSAFLMPSLGADMEAGTLVEQLVAPGEPVHRGDVIAAVETQKGVIEIEAFEEGILTAWLVPVGTRVPVGAPLAAIGAVAQDKPEPEVPGTTPEEAPQPTDPTPEPATPEDRPYEEPMPTPPGPEIPDTRPEEGARRLRITPAARRLAAELGVDLTAPRAWPDHAITRQDILGLAPRTKPPPATDMRAAIAAAMSRSKREIPHYYLSHMVDLTAADAFVSAANADRAPEDRLLLGAVAARALVSAVASFPEFNGHFDGRDFRPAGAVHLGFAIHIRQGGLVAPALLDAQSRDLDTLMQNLRDLIARVRAGRFRARELSDATLTLTALGTRGVDTLYGVIYPPQVAIVGLGTPRPRPMVQDGAVAVRLAARLTLAADHRVSDGHRGALFLRAIDKNLQNVEAL